MNNVKQKIEEGLYDERSAGGLVYKIENNKVLWLLIKTISGFKTDVRKIGKQKTTAYKFPKGHLKEKEFLKTAALREVEEEGQVKAKIIDKLGSNNYIIWDREERKKIIKKVTFFLMDFVSNSNLKHYDNEGVLDREWMTYETATGKLAYDSEKVLLRKAKQKLDEILKIRK